MAKTKEQYAQIGYLVVVESAANTLTFNGLSVFSNVLGQKGMIIHQAEYSQSAAELALLAANGDGITFGLAGDDSMVSVSLNDPEVYDYNFQYIHSYGTGDGILSLQRPYVKSFEHLPGGGILVPADRLYAYVQGVALGGASGVTVRFWYTIIDLSAQEYLELAQSMRVLK